MPPVGNILVGCSHAFNSDRVASPPDKDAGSLQEATAIHSMAHTYLSLRRLLRLQLTVDRQARNVPVYSMRFV